MVKDIKMIVDNGCLASQDALGAVPYRRRRLITARPKRQPQGPRKSVEHTYGLNT